MTAKPRGKPVQMACLTIGHYDYLVPAASAMKIADLLQDAFECERDWEDSGQRYTVKTEQPRVAFALVRPNQLRMPQGDPVPVPTKPRLLR